MEASQAGREEKEPFWDVEKKNIDWVRRPGGMTSDGVYRYGGRSIGSDCGYWISVDEEVR